MTKPVQSSFVLIELPQVLSCLMDESIGYNSFNLALYSGPLKKSRGWRVNLSMITRTAMLPYYRSDAMHLERLHWEAAVDRLPEEIAAELRIHFEAA